MIFTVLRQPSAAVRRRHSVTSLHGLASDLSAEDDNKLYMIFLVVFYATKSKKKSSIK